jgi:hypothetical protein
MWHPILGISPTEMSFTCKQFWSNPLDFQRVYTCEPSWWGIFADVQHAAQHGKVANGIMHALSNPPSSSFQFFSQNGTKRQKLMTIIA